MSDIILKENETRERIYTASAGQTDFAVPFWYEGADEMGVTVTTAAGVTSQPAFTMVPAGKYGTENQPGILRLDVPLTGGERVEVYGVTPLGRVTSLSANSGNPSAKLNEEYSNLQKQIQELGRTLSRSLLARRGESLPVLPAKSAIAGKIAYLNPAATGYETIEGQGLSAIADDLLEGNDSAVRRVAQALLGGVLDDILGELPRVLWAETRADMAALSAELLADGCLVQCEAAASPGDGGARMYVAREGSALVADGETILDHDVLDFQFIALEQDFHGATLSGPVTLNASSMTIARNQVIARAIGAAAAGGQTGEARVTSFSGHAGGTSDVRASQEQVLITGANPVQQANVRNIQMEARHVSGTVTFLYGIQGYNRLGLAGSDTGNVTTSRGIEWHTANESSGNIANAYNFLSGEVDLLDGSGAIGTMIGFFAQDQGHATRIANAAYGFFCGNMTQGAPITAAFATEMSSGTGKWAFRGAGSAPNGFVGPTRIGNAGVPTDALEVVGLLKATRDGTIGQPGGFHELSSQDNGFVAHVRNTHASAPDGFRVRFISAAPDNNTQMFALFEDSASTRCIIYSDGDIVNHDNSFGGISDARLKQDIVPARSQAEDFRRFDFRNYRLISDVEAYGEDAKELLGLIAQDLLDVSPGLVRHVVRDAVLDDDGKEIEPACEHYEVRYSVLYMKAAKALQEVIHALDRAGIPIGDIDPGDEPGSAGASERDCAAGDGAGILQEPVSGRSDELPGEDLTRPPVPVQLADRPVFHLSRDDIPALCLALSVAERTASAVDLPLADGTVISKLRAGELTEVARQMLMEMAS